MSRVCEVIIYTSNAALSFNVEATTTDFQERLASALEEGTVIWSFPAVATEIRNKSW